MFKILTQYFFLLLCLSNFAQNFVRSELATTLDNPWEIICGQDGFLWLSESGGKVSRIDPVSGFKTTVYSASDYFGGSPLEKLNACFQPNIGAGTLGMAMHPDFKNPSTSFIYLVYSYNSGTALAPATKFKIERLTWSSISNAITEHTSVVLGMPSGYDHLGGRLMIIEQNGIPYLFFTVGDNGISETNSPDCYNPQSNNPNNFAQDPNTKNGKVHRFNLDGTIPSDNPIPGNSFYTRGHRNPQGLMFNPVQNIIYDIEHGDRTDDEINVLEAGKNYGWKNVRGYHDDNFLNESAYITSYTANPIILNDGLKEPLYAWCSVPQPTNESNADWCTVAPSDGIYYGNSSIPDFKNSLLVVTLKNGTNTDQELYRFKLNSDGVSMLPNTADEPNPKKYFAEDQDKNGRLRDIAVSLDGKKIYLINNGGTARDKITVYTYNGPEIDSTQTDFYLKVYPNPSNGEFRINCSEEIVGYDLFNALGEIIQHISNPTSNIDITLLPEGPYFIRAKTTFGKIIFRKVIKLK